MIEGDQVYVVTAYRWGNRDLDSYPVGVFTSLERAELAGREVAFDRGGKYGYAIDVFPLDVYCLDLPGLSTHEVVDPEDCNSDQGEARRRELLDQFCATDERETEWFRYCFRDIDKRDSARAMTPRLSTVPKAPNYVAEKKWWQFWR